MEFHDYQEFTRTTAIYPKEQALTYLALGLTSEAGEVAGKVKKLIRDSNESLTFMKDLVSELGDVLWYVARLADEINVDLFHVAALNKDKLITRKERGTIGGSGDTR
jgi:NTP pyrophosphatase (non-canonical NTP hydrolase)